MPIQNLREFPFTLNGQQYTVIGMANPTRSNQITDAITELQNLGVKHVIALEPDSNSQQSIMAAKMQYTRMPVRDFKAPTRLDFEQAFTIITTPNTGVVAIHCAAGLGRTGAVLASLKLRELIETDHSTDNSTDKSTDKTSMVLLGRFSSVKYTLSTPLVAQAIQAIRNVGLGPGGTPEEKSVEMPEQVDALCKLQCVLQNNQQANTTPIAHHIAIQVAQALLASLKPDNPGYTKLNELIVNGVSDDGTLNRLICTIQKIAAADSVLASDNPEVNSCYQHIMAHQAQKTLCNWLKDCSHVFFVNRKNDCWEFCEFISQCCGALIVAIKSCCNELTCGYSSIDLSIHPIA